MDILKLLRKRTSVRKYSSQPISKQTLAEIIDAAFWGPSVHGLQPARYVVVEKREMITRLSEICSQQSKKLYTGPNVILKHAAQVLNQAQVLILAYNQKSFQNVAKRFREEYVQNAELSELLSIAASIQNLLIAAEAKGVGSCWFAIPVLCKKAINEELKETDELVSIISLGYPEEKGKRSKRKNKSDFLRRIS